jgi:hypothetical protein
MLPREGSIVAGRACAKQEDLRQKCHDVSDDAERTAIVQHQMFPEGEQEIQPRFPRSGFGVV